MRLGFSTQPFDVGDRVVFRREGQLDLGLRVGTADPAHQTVRALCGRGDELDDPIVRLRAPGLHGVFRALIDACSHGRALRRIAAQIKPKEVTRPGGYIGRVVAAGEAEMAFQQIVELMAVPGIEVVGPIPPELQFNFDSKAAIFAESKNPDAARALLAYLARAEHAAKFVEAGLEQLQS